MSYINKTQLVNDFLVKLLFSKTKTRSEDLKLIKFSKAYVMLLNEHQKLNQCSQKK